MRSDSLSLYVHWPFCESKCPYCTFNSHVSSTPINHELWKKNYQIELDYFADFIRDRNIKSIFFGGGTPSTMSPDVIESVINGVSKIARFNDNIEIVAEANPMSSSRRVFEDMRNAGINRISIGVQSFNDKNLGFLGREHSSNQAIETINHASLIFKRYSFDLIYALPNQSISDLELELNTALSLCSDHLSIYQLCIEKGSPFYDMQRKGEIVLPDDDFCSELYNLVQNVLGKKNLRLYEISNYSKPSMESLHNLAYWKYENYLGIGPGACSRLSDNDNNVISISQIYDPRSWELGIANNGNAIQKYDILSIEDIAKEYILTGMRTIFGVDVEKFRKWFNINLLDYINLDCMEKFININIINFYNGIITVNDKYMIVLDRVLSELIKAKKYNK